MKPTQMLAPRILARIEISRDGTSQKPMTLTSNGITTQFKNATPTAFTSSATAYNKVLLAAVSSSLTV